MKKIIAFLLALTMVFTLAACGNTPSEPTQAPTQSPTQIPTQESTQPPTQVPTQPESSDAKITIAQALAMPLQDGEIAEGRYLITATVESITNANYGAMVIRDDTGSISVYGSYNEDGSLGYAKMDEKPYKGDTVQLSCTIQNYKGTMEIKDAWILSFTPAEITLDPNEYSTITIGEARNASIGTKIIVSGVVAKITYANGMIPAGFILADETSSIYIYSRDAAARVKEGNAVTLAASKTWWILPDEQNNASKFVYKGCNQLEDAVVISVDEENAQIPTGWIEEATVKSILDTPVDQDISSKIYKVTALIRKVEGTGFTNYYINDLDGETGSYAYSQCNGSDFDWLDQYDGKICTVYLVALNAKSTPSECFWRFLPVSVSDDNFDVSKVNVAQHVVEYYGIGQFLPEYSGDPALALMTTVDSQLLNFSGATLSYQSSDEKVIQFEDNVMHCVGSGSATITITGSYGDNTYREEITISVTKNEDVSSITVQEAIDAASGTDVTVHGIVGPSLVNQNGFYLIDSTGIIAVLMDSATLEQLTIGDEVVLSGQRYTKNEGGNYYGQTLIKDAQILSNSYGNHEYCDDTFVTGTTLKDFYGLDVNVDYSTTVFVVKAIVQVVESQYYTTIQLIDNNGTKVSLYCSSAGQYGWLKQFSNQEVTLELTACNWNGKNHWRGCVLAVILEDGSKVINDLNFQ